MADIVLALGTLTIEIMAKAKPTSKAADDALFDIANTLLDMERKITNARSKMLIGAVARYLVKTEEGA